MPEGPELRRSADFLEEKVVGRRIAGLKSLPNGRYIARDPIGLSGLYEALRDFPDPGAYIDGVNCKGKFMWWTLRVDEKPWWLWVTYGMSGQWLSERGPHAAFKIWFEDDSAVYFNDQRHFGTLKFVNNQKEHARKLRSLGPDMLNDPPNPLDFCAALAKRKNKTLAEALMDQSVISGVGNYIKAESLYLAELSPHRLVNSLTGQEAGRLREQIINVMTASYKSGGATIQTYRNPDGTAGQAQRRFVVYGHDKDPMGNEVIKEETKDGRTTHWCPAVQR